MALLMGKYATVGNQTAVNGIKTSSLETAVDSMSINQRVHRLVPWAFVEVQHRVSFTIKDCSYFLVPTSPYVIFVQISDIILRFQVGAETRSEVKYLSVYGGPTTLQVRPLPHLRVLSLKRNMSAPTFTNFLRPPLLMRQFISLTQNIFLFEIITYSNLQITHSERSLGDTLFIFNKSPNSEVPHQC